MDTKELHIIFVISYLRVKLRIIMSQTIRMLRRSIKIDDYLEITKIT